MGELFFNLDIRDSLLSWFSLQLTSGWGQTRRDGPIEPSHQLMKVNAPIVVDDYCEKKVVTHFCCHTLLIHFTGLPNEHWTHRNPELCDHRHEDLCRRSSRPRSLSRRFRSYIGCTLSLCYLGSETDHPRNPNIKTERVPTSWVTYFDYRRSTGRPGQRSAGLVCCWAGQLPTWKHPRVAWMWIR